MVDMTYLSPIFTEHRQCQDCYKCVRHCPVKAIKIEAGCARVMPELCIYCGNCVTVCPNQAKKVRDDLQKVQQLLRDKSRVVVSLAPSFVAEFPGIRPGQIIAALKRLGFWGASETALGAQQVSAHVAELVRRNPGAAWISSACPTVVAYLQKYSPRQAMMLTPLLSPLLAHAKFLRATFGPEIGVVFLGPCIAKKIEADNHPDVLDVALTFAELRRWLDQARIDLPAIAQSADDRFIPEPATDGAIYPVDGGMIAGIRSNCCVNDGEFMSFSGLSGIQKAIAGLEDRPADRGMVIELLACEGGCINGPAMSTQAGTIRKRCQVLQSSQYPSANIPRRPEYAIAQAFAAPPPPADQTSDAMVRSALRDVGKFCPEDELNCGGCGYDSCRDFGRALLAGKAERAMCVTYMRQLAHKKANALIQKIPSAVVIVGPQLQVLECNSAFANLLSPGASRAEASPSLEGKSLSDLVPFHKLFTAVLQTGEDIVDRDLRFGKTILHLSIFTIEKHTVAGGIIQDITEPAVQKEQVIRRAREVIQHNLATVQQIAYLLGEHAAESETTLNSIIDSFAPPSLDDLTIGGGAASPPADAHSGDAKPAPEPAQDGAHRDNDQWRELYRH